MGQHYQQYKNTSTRKISLLVPERTVLINKYILILLYNELRYQTSFEIGPIQCFCSIFEKNWRMNQYGGLKLKRCEYLKMETDVKDKNKRQIIPPFFFFLLHVYMLSCMAINGFSKPTSTQTLELSPAPSWCLGHL